MDLTATAFEVGGLEPLGAELAVVAALRHAPLLVLVALHLCASGSAGSAGSPGDGGPAGGGSAGAGAAGPGGRGGGAGAGGGASKGRRPAPRGRGSALEGAAEASRPAAAPRRDAEAGEETCSKALGFNESTGPKDRAFQDLLACDEHHKRTCCERHHTAKVRTAWIAFSQERSARCAKMGQLALCSLCDGDVASGLKSRINTVLLCPSFCARWFQACLSDYFAPDGAAGLQPCGAHSLVCSPVNEITKDAADFCARVAPPLGGAFAQGAAEDESVDACFDGVPAARTRGRAPKAPYTRPPRRGGGGISWWRQFLPRSLGGTLRLQLPSVVEKYAPSVAIGMVGALFTWYMWRNMD